MKEPDAISAIKELVDFLLPELTPYELSFYIFLLRKSHFEDGSEELRVGKRTIASNCGKGTRSDKANFAHVTTVLNSLEAKGCIQIGNTTREGTLYRVKLPRQIPFVTGKIAALEKSDSVIDYFNDQIKRRELFERDKWLCYYCGERVTEENATLDHYIPVSLGGSNSPDNLFTSCLVYNSVKSGKRYEEAAPLILKSIRDRTARRSTSGSNMLEKDES